MTDSWGYLGKPPKDILDGSATKDRMDMFRMYQTQIERAKKIVNSKLRSVQMAEIKAKYKRNFPSED